MRQIKEMPFEMFPTYHYDYCCYAAVVTKTSKTNTISVVPIVKRRSY